MLRHRGRYDKGMCSPVPFTIISRSAPERRAIPLGINLEASISTGCAHLAVEGAGRDEGGEAISGDSPLKIIIV